MASTRPTPRNVVFISRQRLVGATNGSSAYLLDLARAVRDAGFVPHLVQPSATVAGRWPVLSLRPEMDVFATHQIRGLIRVGRRFVTPTPSVYVAIARSVAAGVARRLGLTGGWTQDRPLPYAVAIPWTAADHRWLAQATRGKADIAISDYMFCAEGIASLPDPSVPSAIIMHDLFHARKGGGADSVALVTREQEVAMLGRADVVVAIQPAEAAFVADHVPDTRAIVAPMAATPVTAAQPGEEDRLLFVGSNTAPNVVGLQWFFDAVWPAVRAACPNATLDVAGTVGRAFDTAPDGVRLLGLVDDLDPLYTRAGVVISPLTFGSGLKIKLIEALARGKAIVATPITVEGAERETDGAVHVTDDAARFAAHVVSLNRDVAARTALAGAALDAARRHYGAATCYAGFVEWLRGAG